MLLDDEFYRDATSGTESGFVIVEIKTRNADEEARIERLDSNRHPYQSHKQIVYAHGNRAHPVTVESVNHRLAGGKTTYILKLRPHETPSSSTMGFGSWADEAAKRQALLLLLNEATEGTPSGYFATGFFDRGGISNKGIFPPLWNRLQGRRMQATDLLRCARLEALYHLKASGIVDHISELVLGPATKGLLTVRFKGRRSGYYLGQDGTLIEFIGKCNLAMPQL